MQTLRRHPHKQASRRGRIRTRLQNKELIAEAREFVLNSDDCEYGELLMWMADALEKLEGENRWIPVEERLPDEEKDVYIYFDRCGGDCAVGYMAKGIGMWVVDHSKLWYHVTHWRPLPEPPTDEVK